MWSVSLLSSFTDWAARALTDVRGVGELLGRQDGVLQGVLVVGGRWLVVGIVFHGRLFLLVRGLVVAIVLLIRIVIGTFIVVFFLPTRDRDRDSLQRSLGSPPACVCPLSAKPRSGPRLGTGSAETVTPITQMRTVRLGSVVSQGQQVVDLRPLSRSSDH